MNYKNGREAKNLDQVIGTIGEGADGRVIAGTIQLNPDPTKTIGAIHVQDEKAGVQCHPVHIANCYHAEDAFVALSTHAPANT